MTTTVRPEAVAGLFYPASPADLRAAVHDAFDRAVAPAPDPRRPIALVVPHAGYVYSGPVAASAYRRLVPHRDRIRRVVALGPSHRVYLAGMAVPSVDAFRTPLGDVAVDRELRDRCLRLPGMVVDDAPHRDEHSLEVQLPFLQSVLDEFTVVPIVVGDADPSMVATVVESVWDEPDVLLLVSTDLSHYHRYEVARELDGRTAAHITSLDESAVADRDACGARPLRGLLRAAAARRATIELVDLRSSGDTAGDRRRVVGYGAFAVG